MGFRNTGAKNAGPPSPNSGETESSRSSATIQRNLTRATAPEAANVRGKKIKTTKATSG